MIHLLPGPDQPDAPGTRRWLPSGWPVVAFSTTLYLTLAVWMTWPLVPRLNRQLVGDLGDPLFVTWVLTWVMTHLTRALRGDLTAIDQLWNANIFYPEPNTLALSEHFVGQSIQALPVWWLTGNPIAAYNVSVLSAFVLTAVGTMMLTRAFTGGFVAPFLAGVVSSFNTYRFGLELSHLHVLSIQWLPLAMLALHRFIESGSRGWLVASGLFVLALNLSSGYYMLFCAPFLAAFVLVDLAIQGRLRSPSRWFGLAVAAISVALVTTPFVLPYLAMQRRLGFVRSLEEVKAYSATFAQYGLYLLPWAGVPIALSAIGLLGMAARRPSAPRAYTVVIAAFVLLAVWLSLGPIVQPWGVPGPYALLYDYVPGFTGLRVVNRYGALMVVFMAVLAGIGAGTVRRVRFAGVWIVLALTGCFLWQVWPGTLPLNAPLPSAGLHTPPPYLDPAPRLPSIYLAVQGLDREAVIAELPFGDPWYDLRYMYFAGLHERRIMNGYSGIFPPSYVARQRALASPLDQPQKALDALGQATHVIVHEAAWPDDTGRRLVEWLEAAGALPIASADSAQLLALHPVVRHAHARPPAAP